MKGRAGSETAASVPRRIFEFPEPRTAPNRRRVCWQPGASMAFLESLLLKSIHTC